MLIFYYKLYVSIIQMYKTYKFGLYCALTTFTLTLFENHLLVFIPPETFDC